MNELINDLESYEILTEDSPFFFFNFEILDGFYVPIVFKSFFKILLINQQNNFYFIQINIKAIEYSLGFNFSFV